MEYSTITITLLNFAGALAVIFILGFLIYGMIKGVNLEKELRLRNRRRYS